MTIQLFSAALVAILSSSAISALIVLSQGWHGKHTLDHDLTGVQKFHKHAVPRIGGLAVAGAIVLTIAYSYFRAPTLYSERDLKNAALLFLAAMPVFFAGITEDLTKRVSVKARLAASVASALLASWLLGATVDRLDIWGFDVLLAWTPFALVITAVTVAGGINSINIIDGFNGLAASTAAIMLAALAVVAWQVGDNFVTTLAVVGIGGTLGFLILNFPAGKLFLGDGGAYFLGFWVSETVVLLLVRNDRVSAWQILSICAYPVIEVLFSIYRRKIVRKTNPGEPDGLHMHTLVYRRVASRIVGRHSQHPWKRNAVVTCVIAPWIVAMVLLSVVAGGAASASVMIVVVQLIAYITVYARLVRGRWGLRNVRASTRKPNENRLSSS